MRLRYLVSEVTILVTVAFLQNALAASKWNAEPVKYVISFPSIWRANKNFDFHLVLFQNPNYTLPVTFVANVTLQGRSVATQTFQQTSYGYQKHTFRNIMDARMPSQDSDGDDEYYGYYSMPEVTVKFLSRGMENYSDISGYANKLEDKFVFIQTDKANYKPAQNVKIRVLAIDRDLKALTSSDLSVTVTDPNEHTIQEWTDQSLQNGMYSVNFSMSDFVSLGAWTITAKGTNIPETRKSFTVQQYVLPKYEVKVDFPNKYWVASSDETTYKGYVKAKYTFGKPVRGKASVVLTSTGGCSWRYDYRPTYDENQGMRFYQPTEVTTQPPPFINITVNLAGDGSPEDGAFIVKGLNRVLHSENNSYVPTPMTLPNDREECGLTFNVNVTEELTGELMKASESVVLHKTPYSIKVHDSVQKTLKPGLPFTMRFQVTKPDDTPITTPVDVLIQVYHDTTNQTAYPYYWGGGSNACYKMQNMGNSYGYGYAQPAVDVVSVMRYPGPGYLSTPGTPKEKIVTQNFTVRTDSDGLVEVTVTPPKDVVSSGFLATIPSVRGAQLCETRSPPQSASSNSVSIAVDRQLSQSKTIPKVGDKIRFAITASFKTTYVYFLFSQNGQILDYRKLTQPQAAANNATKFSVEITLPAEATPQAAALAWTMEDSANEVLADAIQFSVDGFIRQNVTAAFTPGAARPREATSLRLKTTEPNTPVALLAVDKSVLLLGGGNDITLDDVLGRVGAGSGGMVSPVLYRCGRCGWWPSWIDSSNAESVFSGVGMTVKSNAITSNSYSMPPIMVDDAEFGGPLVLQRAPGGGAGMDGGVINAMPMMPSMVPGPMPAPSSFSGADSATAFQSVPQQEPVVRKNFPESWIWEVVQTNSAGDFSKSYQAPDTITTWVLSALAVGQNNGFGGLSSPAELNVFQDFFVNLDVSHPTIIRGEQVEIKAVVFNYQPNALRVTTTLKQSPDFEVSNDGGRTFRSRVLTQPAQVSANDGTSLPIWIKPRKLGNINLELSGVATNNANSADAMRKEVLVEPEGEVRYANKPTLIRLVGGTTSMKQTINVDEMLGNAVGSVVNGSKVIQLQAMGDILGPALTNLGKQIRLPTGCGEQTMLTLAPNVHIYKYLKSAGTLTPEVEQKAIGFVDQGYQHELTYQREDGGFSAFGASDPASSTWLTAFVIRCFHAAVKHMNTQISPGIFTNTWGFLKRQAKSDGLFTEPGRVIHTSMKGGGATSDVNLATYVYTTWAEAGGLDQYKWTSLAATKNQVVKAGTSATNKDAYQLALAAYALSILPADKPTSLTILNRLISLATQKDGLLYWDLAGSNRTDVMSWETSGPTQIETAAYALLAMMNHGKTDNAINVARWLTSKRNSLGGFESTQDTVVGLQALSEIAPMLSSRNTALNIAANFVFTDGKGNLSTNFRVDSRNARVLQSFDPDRLRQALKYVELSVTGTGVGLVQLAMKYNVLNQRLLDSGDYTIIVTRDVTARKRREPATQGQLTDVNVQLKACTKPVTSRVRQGMVVMEVGVPTGFDLDLEATQAANKVNNVYKSPLKMVESGDRKIVYYFDTLENSRAGQGACVVGKITRKTHATNVQPPMARVYSYYQPARSNVTQFSFRGMSLGA